MLSLPTTPTERDWNKLAHLPVSNKDSDAPLQLKTLFFCVHSVWRYERSECVFSNCTSTSSVKIPCLTTPKCLKKFNLLAKKSGVCSCFVDVTLMSFQMLLTLNLRFKFPLIFYYWWFPTRVHAEWHSWLVEFVCLFDKLFCIILFPLSLSRSV